MLGNSFRFLEDLTSLVSGSLTPQVIIIKVKCHHWQSSCSICVFPNQIEPNHHVKRRRCNCSHWELWQRTLRRSLPKHKPIQELLAELHRLPSMSEGQRWRLWALWMVQKSLSITVHFRNGRLNFVTHQIANFSIIQKSL